MERIGEAKRCSFSTKNTKLFWSHGVRLLEQLNAQRKFETFCDVVIHVGDNGSFSAHRCILAASSAKLHTLMFATSNDCSRNVHLDGVTVSGFKIVLEFIYTGILSFDVDTITDVITAATYLEMPGVVRLCEEFTSSRREVDDNDVKVEGRNSPQFSLATVAQTASVGSHTRSSDGRLDRSLMTGATSPWFSRFVPSTDTAEDYSSMFDASFDQYYSSCKERGIIPPDCNQTNNAVPQQSRSVSLSHCVADTMHQMSYDSNTSGRNCSSLQHQAFLDEDNDTQSPPDGAMSDVAPKLEQSAENFDGSQSNDHFHSEPSKQGKRCRVKQRRKSESPSKTKCKLSVDTTPVTTQTDKNKQKSVRMKMRKRKSDRDVEKNEENVEDGSESDAKLTESAGADVVHMCEHCGKEFPSANVLTRHKRTHSSRIFHCSICSTDFAEPVAFKRHSVVIHEIHRPFTCSHAGCNYRSDRLSNVEKHMSIHSPTHAFACSLCGRTFAQDAGLRSHMLSCMASRSFLCDLCGSAFNHLQSMQSHQRVHTGERPYRCADCDSTFADHRNYKRHRRIHDNAFPYACMLCGKRFRHSNSLKSHLGSHGIMTKPVEGTPPHSSQPGGLGVLTKPVESTSSTLSQPSHTLAHTAF